MLRRRFWYLGLLLALIMPVFAQSLSPMGWPARGVSRHTAGLRPTLQAFHG